MSKTFCDGEPCECTGAQIWDGECLAADVSLSEIWFYQNIDDCDGEL